MKRLTSTLLSTLAAAATVAAIAPTASAYSLTGTHDGWTYMQDSADDSTGGGGIFEIFGMAYKQEGNTLSFALNADIGIEGHDWRHAKDKNIGWGDLVLTFGDVEYGVHFAGTNDSGVSETGLYSDITRQDVTKNNHGWSRFSSYANYVGAESTHFGDERDVAHFANRAKRQSGNSLASGTHEGDITMLGSSELLDFGAAFGGDETGDYTFGFSFEMTEAMTGEFVAELWLECINDSIALDGIVASKTTSHPVGVPEPTAMLGLLGATAFGGTRLRRRNDDDDSAIG